MQYNISFIQQINRILTRCIMYFIVFATVLIIYDKGLEKIYLLAGIPFILICFFIIERYIYNAIPYLLLHGLFFAFPFIFPFPSKVYILLYCGLLVMECHHAQYVWKHNADKPYDSAPWEFYLLISVVCLVAKAYHYEDIVTIIFYGGILLFLLHFIQLYVEGLRGVLIKSQKATSVPTKKMILFSSMMVLFILVIFITSCLLSKGYHIDTYMEDFGKWLGELLLAILKWMLYIITLIKAYFAKNRDDTAIEAQQKEYEQAFSGIYNDVAQPTVIAHIIYGILAIFVYGVIIYLLYQAFRYFYSIYERRYVTDADITTKLDSARDTQKLLKTKPAWISRLKENLSQDNRFKIRNLYRLYVKKHKAYNHRICNTPKDIEKKIFELYDEDMSELTTLYEKARYSNQEITNEDIEKGGNLS
ncbi:MAG: hypothetical protein ACI4F4_07695 [Lachnospiraceae bacterium]